LLRRAEEKVRQIKTIHRKAQFVLSLYPVCPDSCGAAPQVYGLPEKINLVHQWRDNPSDIRNGFTRAQQGRGFRTWNSYCSVLPADLAIPAEGGAASGDSNT